MSRTDQPTHRFRILSVDGGGIRGLIPARVIAEIERRLQAAVGPEVSVANYFHMFAGTSTGGLVALALTAPESKEPPQRPRLSASELADLYIRDGPAIFRQTRGHKIRTLGGWIGPKYGLGPLQEAVEDSLGGENRLADALRDLVVTSYDMTGREPYFFKRWRARDDPQGERNARLVDAALATSAAPTYFPSHGIGGRALVDGGVFAANPIIAAIVEALKRKGDEPHSLSPDELLVVSIGTGLHERGYDHERVRRWGKVGWVRPRDGEPPLLAAMLGGSSDGADHWAHTLLNHPQSPRLTAAEVGRGPRFLRLQAPLDPPVAMDDVSPTAFDRLEDAAKEIIASPELDRVVQCLLRFDPCPFVERDHEAGSGQETDRRRR